MLKWYSHVSVHDCFQKSKHSLVWSEVDPGMGALYYCTTLFQLHPNLLLLLPLTKNDATWKLIYWTISGEIKPELTPPPMI